MARIAANVVDVPPGPAARAGVRHHAGLLLAVVCAVQFLDAMDIASMSPALPLIQRDLGMSASELQWVVSAYAVGFGGFLLLGGRLADLFGRKRLLIGWLLVFAAASLVGSLTDSATVLTLGRFVKGISAGFTAPAAMALLLDAYRDEQQRNRALGAFLAIASTGFSLGLVLGGVLASVSWRLVLVLPAVAGLAVAGLAAVVVAPDPAAVGNRGPLDIAGATTVTGGAMAFVYALSRAATAGWTEPVTLVVFSVAAGLLGAFTIVERRHPAPLIPLEFFTRPQIARAIVCMLFFGAYVGFQFVATLYYQDELGWSPLRTGLAFLLGGVLTATTAAHLARRVAKVGAWPMATAGLLMLTTGYLGFVLLLGHVATPIFLVPQQILGGVGFAAAYPALNIISVGQARADEQGLASGLFNSGAQIGTGVMVAVVASVFAANAGTGLAGYRVGLWIPAIVTGVLTLLAGAGIARYRRVISGSVPVPQPASIN